MTARPQSTRTTRHIGILLFDGVEELDAVGPWEVLAAWTRFHPQDGWAVSCLSTDGGSVRCAKGLVVGAHHSLADAPPLDVLIHPGGVGGAARYVDDGDMITSAGVSAGIDMALYLIERLVSAERARDAQRYVQYDHGPYPLAARQEVSS